MRGFASTRMTSLDYRHPYRPLPVRIINGIGGMVHTAGDTLGIEGALRPDTLIRRATRKTGLSDFGDEYFREGLEELIRSVRAEANLHTVGRLITIMRIENALHCRLRVEEYLDRFPETEKIDVSAPVVITGLQRTGTTLLHRLLAADPVARSLASWEAINPVPPDSDSGKDSRERKAKLSETALSYLAPDFFAIHPVEAAAPEEDVLLLDYTFSSTVPEATLRVPTYSKWVEEHDQVPAYRYMRTLLRILLRQRPGEFWVLKTPHHLEFMDTLFAVFPGTRVIQTHRDPFSAVTSFCSMVSHGRGVFSDTVDPVEVGTHWSRKIHRMITRAMESRSRLPADRFLDVSYYDLVANPLNEIERVYRFLGRPLDGRTEEAIHKTLAQNTKDRYGRHKYNLESFGLTAGTIEELFSAYMKRYDIPTEYTEENDAAKSTA